MDLALQLILSISALKTKLHINHAVTLVEDGNELFIYDPTNLCAFNIKDASKASLVNGEGEIELNSLLTFLIGSNPDPHYLFNKLLEGDFTSNLSSDKFVTSWEQALKLFSENKKLLNDAYYTVHSDLEFIDKQTDEIGGSIKIYINNSLKK